MTHLCGGPRLAQETEPRRFVTQIPFANDLEGYRASQISVERNPDTLLIDKLLVQAWDKNKQFVFLTPPFRCKSLKPREPRASRYPT